MVTRTAFTVLGLILVVLWGLSCSEPKGSNGQPQCTEVKACHTPGYRRCDGAWLFVCQDHGGCGEWVPVIKCSSYQACLSGECREEDASADAADDICEPHCPIEAGCGDDGCGGSCGTCTGGAECEHNSCVHTDPDWELECSYICGEAECGLVENCYCGECLGNDICVNSKCGCPPRCRDRECGPDGCGGDCGVCPPTMACYSNGRCGPWGNCEAKVYSDLVCKISELDVGAGGRPGEAVDVDDDPDTCAPEANCQDGLNNALWDLYADPSAPVDVSAEISKGLASGQTTLLLELQSPNTQGAEFTLNMYSGAAVTPRSECDFQTSACAYYVAPDSLDPVTCRALVQFTNAKIDGNQLTAGGPDEVIYLQFPLLEGASVTLPLHWVQIRGTVSLNPMTISDGLLAGAIPKKELVSSLDSLPAEAFAELSFGLDMLRNFVQMFVVPDIDLDGNDEADGVSVTLKFQTIPGSIVGLEPSPLSGKQRLLWDPSE